MLHAVSTYCIASIAVNPKCDLTDLSLSPPAGPAVHEISDDRPGERGGGRFSPGGPHQDPGGNQRILRDCRQ